MTAERYFNLITTRAAVVTETWMFKLPADHPLPAPEDALASLLTDPAAYLYGYGVKGVSELGNPAEVLTSRAE